MWSGHDVYIHTGTALQHAENIKNGYRPDIKSLNCPVWFKALIEQCWATPPQNRPTLETILKQLRTMSKESTSTAPGATAKQYVVL